MTPREELDQAIREIIDKQVALSDKAALKALGDELGLASMATREAMLNGLSYDKIRTNSEYDMFDNLVSHVVVYVSDTIFSAGVKFTIRLKEPSEADNWLTICSIEDGSKAGYYTFYEFEDLPSFPEAFIWCIDQLNKYIGEAKDLS